MMLELEARLQERTRTPPPNELAQAFVEFFRQKVQHRRPVEEIQAQHAITTFLHLQETYGEVEGFGLTSDELRMALKALKTRVSKKPQNQAFIDLAKLLFGELKKRREATVVENRQDVPFFKDVNSYIQVLSQSGDALGARDLVEKYWGTDLIHAAASPWTKVLNGLIRERRPEELNNTIERMQNHGVLFDEKIHQVILTYYAVLEGNLEMTKKWYQRPIANDRAPTDYTSTIVLQLCIRKNDLDWGEPIFKAMLESNPDDKKSRDITLQWAAAKGRGVDEIEQMMKVMLRRNEGRENIEPDIDTINALVELANSRNDPYTAERYVTLGQKWGFQPDAKTYLLQLDYRIRVKDLSGAMTAYRHLRSEGLTENEEVPYINRLIVAFCGESNQRYDAIMGLVEDLTERKAGFEVETVSALTDLHLQRGEMDDVVDLLNTHTFQYGLDQRAAIRDVLLSYCQDMTTTTEQAWETYNILRSVFGETDIPTRISLMNSFFTRDRPDMATHVFGHMRQQQIKSLRPDVDAYVACLEGIGRAGDEEAAETVHNMMKLDSEIEPNTRLYNALMLAYTGCGQSTRAQGFWDDIVHSREGPTYASIQIAFQACEKSPFGEKLASEIWQKVKRFELKITREVYAAYIGALAGQTHFDKCVGLLSGAEKEGLGKVDALM